MLNIIGLNHIRMSVTDLDKMELFAKDFGLVLAKRTDERLYLRGAGTSPYHYVAELGDSNRLCAVAFTAENADELQKAIIEYGASPVRDLESPGKGKSVSLTDPDGLVIDLVHGVKERSADELSRSDLIINNGNSKPRKGHGQTVAAFGPPQILNFGHLALIVNDFPTSKTWYNKVLGLIPSEIKYADTKDNELVGFFRLDCGDEWVDHHILALFGFGKSELHHISFEVQDSEAQFIGHRWMEKQGWESIWGVGRHPGGSHIFDLWRAPDRTRFETFSDTDVYTSVHEPEYMSISSSEMDLWSNEEADKYFA